MPVNAGFIDNQLLYAGNLNSVFLNSANVKGEAFTGPISIQGIDIGSGLANAYNAANSAFLQANNSTGGAAFAEANSFQSVINTSFSVANSAQNLALSSFAEANSAQNLALSSFAEANSFQSVINSAFTTANSGQNLALSAFAEANATSTYATSSYAQANIAFNSANNASNVALSAFAVGNTNSTNITILNGVELSQNANIAAAFTLANSTTNLVTNSYNAANAAFLKTNNNITIPSFTQYGGVGDGATHNDNAWTTFTTTVSSSNAVLAFPPGTFVFGNSISYTANSSCTTSSLLLVGCGPDISILQFGGSNGLSVTLNSQNQSFHIRNMTFSTTTASNSTIALNLTQTANVANPGSTAQSDLTELTFRSNIAFSDTSHYWGNAIVINEASCIKFDSIGISGGAPYQNTFPLANATGGNGVQIYGTAANFGVQYNFFNINFANLIVGIQVNQYIQGVTISQFNVTGGYIGLYLPPNCPGVQQVSLTNGSFQSGYAGVYANNSAAAAQIYSTIEFISQPGSYGIYLASMQGGVSILGNNFTGESAKVGTGLATGSGTSGGLIVGNIFQNLAIGYNLSTGSIYAYSNQFVNNTTNFTSGGGNATETKAIASSSNTNPTGTSSVSGVMMGLACQIAFVSSGTVVIIANGTANNSVIGDGSTIYIKIGTGTAPTNNAAITGTTLGQPQQFIASTVAGKAPFSVSAIATGLSLGTLYWIDLGLQSITGGLSQLSQVDIIAYEL